MSDGPYVGVDIGSSTASVVVAVADGEELLVRGFGQARHDGARKSVIADVDAVVRAVRTAAEEAEAMASLPVERAVVGIGGTSIHGVRSTASVPVTGRQKVVTPSDRRRALEACARMGIPPDYTVLDVVPASYSVDGQTGVEQPDGLSASRLDAQAFVLYSHKTHMEAVEQAVNRAGILIERLVYEPLAAAEAVLTPDERELGCLLLDIGASSTEWVVYSEGAVISAGATPVAGRWFTNDLAVLLKTTTAAAEELKKRIGVTAPPEDDDAIEVPAHGGDGMQLYPTRHAAEILHERARDLLVRVHQALVADGAEKAARAGVVLTGGGAGLDGLGDLAEQIFSHPVRLGQPPALAGLGDVLSRPEWAVACGLVLRQHRHALGGSAPVPPRRPGLAQLLRGALGKVFDISNHRRSAPAAAPTTTEPERSVGRPSGAVT